MTTRIAPVRAADADRARAIEDLQALIRRPLRRDSFTAWSRVSAERPELVGDTIWGCVRWSKWSGRPLGTTPSGGLEVLHRFEDTFWYVDEDARMVEVEGWFPGHPVSTWEAEDRDDYVVGFMAYQAPHKANRIEVRLADGVVWEVPSGFAGRGRRRIDPPIRDFEASGAPILLDEFVITYDALGVHS